MGMRNFGSGIHETSRAFKRALAAVEELGALASASASDSERRPKRRPEHRGPAFDWAKARRKIFHDLGPSDPK